MIRSIPCKVHFKYLYCYSRGRYKNLFLTDKMHEIDSIFGAPMPCCYYIKLLHTHYSYTKGSLLKIETIC